MSISTISAYWAYQQSRATQERPQRGNTMVFCQTNILFFKKYIFYRLQYKDNIGIVKFKCIRHETGCNAGWTSYFTPVSQPHTLKFQMSHTTIYLYCLKILFFCFKFFCLYFIYNFAVQKTFCLCVLCSTQRRVYLVKYTCASVYRNVHRGSKLERSNLIILEIPVFYHRLIHIAFEGRHIRIWVFCQWFDKGVDSV